MTVKTSQPEKDVPYFCTFTCYQWMHLFEITDFYDEIYKWFGILISKRVQILGYVIMPNHLHILIHLPQTAPSINRLIGTGKRFMAYEIVSRLKKLQRQDLLKILEDAVSEKKA